MWRRFSSAKLPFELSANPLGRTAGFMRGSGTRGAAFCVASSMLKRRTAVAHVALEEIAADGQLAAGVELSWFGTYVPPLFQMASIVTASRRATATVATDFARFPPRAAIA